MTERQFGEMVEKYERLVYTICYQFTQNHHTAEDLSQETFLSAYRHLSSCPDESLKPWLARIAANKAKDFLKSAYNRRVSAPGQDAIPEEKGALFIRDYQPEDITLQKEGIRLLQEDIYSLNEPYHQVAVLYFIEEKTVEEISSYLKRPPKTVHTQIYRAKRILQDKQKGGMPDGAVS